MHLCAPMRLLASIAGQALVFANDYAIRARPAIPRLGRFHGDAEFGDTDDVAFLHALDDCRQQWTCLIAQLLFGRGDAAKLVTVTRHFVLQDEVTSHCGDAIDSLSKITCSAHSALRYV